MTALWREIQTLWKSRALLKILVRREVSSRYVGSVGGSLWLYAQPVLTIAAYYLVFDVVFAMRLAESAPTRAAGAFLIVGSLPWMAFCDALSRSMNSLVEGGHILQKNPLPPALLPMRAALGSFVVYGPLLLLVILLNVQNHRFHLAVASVVPFMMAQMLLSLLLGYLLAIGAAALRDTIQIVGFMLSIGVFMSPVLFPAEMFPKDWAWVLWANPITPFAIGYQQVLLKGQWPPAEIWAALGVWLAVAAAALNVAVARSRDQLVDWL